MSQKVVHHYNKNENNDKKRKIVNKGIEKQHERFFR